MSELLKAQIFFAGALRSSSGEEAALSALAGNVERNRDLLAVYRGNAVANAHKALSLAYPVVMQVVGEEFFAALCRAFWREHPSRSGDLNEYGDAFPVFLHGFEHAAEMPYLPAVAELEWHVAQATHAADHEALPLGQLGKVPPESLGDMRLHLQPALSVFRSGWPLASIWQQHQPGWADELDIDLTQPECCAVHRVGLRVEVIRLSCAEHAFWQAALRGEPLSAMLQQAFDEDATFDVQAVLQRGFSAGFVTALDY